MVKVYWRSIMVLSFSTDKQEDLNVSSHCRHSNALAV